MPQPILYLAITNHGFGHATRAAAVAAEIQKQCPDILLILATTTPRSVLEAYLPEGFIHRPRAFDVGVIQPDSLTIDKAATLEKLQQIRQRQSALIASEVAFIQQNKVGLVLADIPPLAAPIARAAGVPAWMMGNFGWDFIYRSWGEEFTELSDWIASCFQQCDRLFRLPFHEPMSAFPHIADVGLTGVDPRFAPEELRKKLGLSDVPKAQTVMMTFGGLGLQKIPYDNLRRFPDWRFLCFDLNAPDLANLIKIGDRHYRPIDLMPLCGRLISKPGYSTFAEACRLEVPLVSLTREEFAEAPILLEGIRDHAYHQILSPAEFFQGDWGFLHQPLQPPRQAEPLDKTGNQTIARSVIDYLLS